MKTILMSVLCLAAALHAAPVFEENFENPEKISFSAFRVDSKNPGAGKYSGHLITAPGAKSDVCVAEGKKVIPVEPGQWYRMSVKNRNDIKIGELKFGLIESRSAEKRVSEFLDWRWKAVSLNITDWHTDVMEFKTAKNTKGVLMYIRTEGQFSGSSWWDDIRLEKFEKKLPPLEIAPFRASATFTDIPTKSAYILTKGKRGVFTRNDTEYCWETIDLSKGEIKILYRDLPKDSLLKFSLIRGNKVISAKEQKPAGNGTASFNAGLDKLPEGIYIFQADLIQNGKTVFHTEKELWRIDSKKSRTPGHETVRKASAGAGRQRFINEKPYNCIYTMQSPTWGLFGQHRKFCKPDVETYFRNMQEQFGQDLFEVWAWRGPQWDNKRRDFVKKAVAGCREYLDFLQKVNCFGQVSMVLASHKGKKETLDFEEIREFVRGVKDHPALLEWTLDEPEFRHKPDIMKKISDIVRSEDPNHLVNVNLCDPDRFHLYAPSSDIASFDIYPFPGQGLIESQKRTKALLKAFPKAPFDSYLQMFNFNTLEMPTFDQVRGSFLLDRINGSHSLIAYAWGEKRQSFLTDQELQSYYRAIVSMFRRLEPVLRHPAEKQVQIASSHEFVASRTFEDGKDQVLILVNLSNDTPADVAFVHAAKQAEDFFDSAWKYESEKGKHNFRLKPNGTKVLRLKIGK